MRRQPGVELAHERFLLLPAYGVEGCAVEGLAAGVNGRESLEEAIPLSHRHRVGEEHIDEPVRPNTTRSDGIGLG